MEVPEQVGENCREKIQGSDFLYLGLLIVFGGYFITGGFHEL